MQNNESDCLPKASRRKDFQCRSPSMSSRSNHHHHHRSNEMKQLNSNAISSTTTTTMTTTTTTCSSFDLLKKNHRARSIYMRRRKKKCFRRSGIPLPQVFIEVSSDVDTPVPEFLIHLMEEEEVPDNNKNSVNPSSINQSKSMPEGVMEKMTGQDTISPMDNNDGSPNSIHSIFIPKKPYSSVDITNCPCECQASQKNRLFSLTQLSLFTSRKIRSHSYTVGSSESESTKLSISSASNMAEIKECSRMLEGNSRKISNSRFKFNNLSTIWNNIVSRRRGKSLELPIACDRFLNDISQKTVKSQSDAFIKPPNTGSLLGLLKKFSVKNSPDSISRGSLCTCSQIPISSLKTGQTIDESTNCLTVERENLSCDQEVSELFETDDGFNECESRSSASSNSSPSSSGPKKPRAISVDVGVVEYKTRQKKISTDLSVSSGSGGVHGPNRFLVHRHHSASLTPNYESKTNSNQDEDAKNALWDMNCRPNAHLWDTTKESGDFCALNEKCSRKGIRRKCLSCRITCHQECMTLLELPCRTTFGSLEGDQSGANIMRHHLVERKFQVGKCSACKKNFQKFFKNSTNYQCSWCKELFHKTDTCLDIARGNVCNLGIHKNVILPPNWITKTQTGYKIIPTDCSTKPLVILINPKSGGKKGAELMKRFQFLLNPRQVFNVFHSNMEFVSELFKEVSELKYLVCGGDGTAGIIMNDLTKLKRSKPLAILPLGTGNDLSRTLGWGSGYNDESLSRIIQSAENGNLSKLDRWHIQANSDVEKLPMNNFNNYFSLGTDAATALAFHNARTLNPDKFQNRIYNKMYYVKVGGIDLVRQAWKDLYDCVTLNCDGVDLSEKINTIRPHVILFLNIPRYGAGTLPWGSAINDNFRTQSFSDGILEVIGLSSKSLAGLHIGGHGERIAQCRKAVITTTKEVPFQIDGEPFVMSAVTLTITATDCSDVIIRNTRRSSHTSINDEDINQLSVQITNFEKFQNNIEDLNLLGMNSWHLDTINFDSNATLSMLRKFLDDKWSNSDKTVIRDHWYFIDIYRKLLIPGSDETCMKVNQAMFLSRYLVLVLVGSVNEISRNYFLVESRSNLACSKTRHFQNLLFNPQWKSETDINSQRVLTQNDQNLEVKSIEIPEIVSEGENIPGPICDESLSDEKSSENKDFYGANKMDNLCDTCETSSASSNSEIISKFDKKNFRRRAIRLKYFNKPYNESIVLYPEDREDPENYAIILPTTFSRKKKSSQKKSKVVKENHPSVDDKSLDALFLKACQRGSLDEVKGLIDKGANVNSLDENGKRASIIASDNENIEVVDYLMKYYFDKEIEDFR